MKCFLGVYVLKDLDIHANPLSPVMHAAEAPLVILM